MSLQPNERAEGEFELMRAAAAVHEELLVAVGHERRTSPETGRLADAIPMLLELHQPVPPDVGGTLARGHGLSTCHGCDRAQFTAARAATWPCRTYQEIAKVIVQTLTVELDANRKALLFPDHAPTRSVRRSSGTSSRAAEHMDAELGASRSGAPARALALVRKHEPDPTRRDPSS
jgi:hypothetical protein